MSKIALRPTRSGERPSFRDHAGPAEGIARDGASTAVLGPGQAIGRAIYIARQHAGLTQADLGRQLGVAQETISHWETGLHVPTGAHVLRLIALLPDFGRLLIQAARQHAATPRRRRPTSRSLIV